MTDYSEIAWTERDERLASIEEKIDATEAKFDKVLTEVRLVGIAVLVVAAMIFFDWPP